MCASTKIYDRGILPGCLGRNLEQGGLKIEKELPLLASYLTRIPNKDLLPPRLDLEVGL